MSWLPWQHCDVVHTPFLTPLSHPSLGPLSSSHLTYSILPFFLLSFFVCLLYVTFTCDCSFNVIPQSSLNLTSSCHPTRSFYPHIFFRFFLSPLSSSLYFTFLRSLSSSSLCPASIITLGVFFSISFPFQFLSISFFSPTLSVRTSHKTRTVRLLNVCSQGGPGHTLK